MPPNVMRPLAGGVPSAAPSAFEVITVGSISPQGTDFTKVRLLILIFVIFMLLFLLCTNL